MKTNQNISDVVRAFQTIDQSCRCIQHRLQPVYQVGWDAEQHTVTVVESGKHQRDGQRLKCVVVGTDRRI